MVQPGKYNKLRVVKLVDFGAYLDGGDEYGEILLPKRYMPDTLLPDDELEVFIYFDSEDRIIATTERPYAQVGEFKMMRVSSTNQIGAFLDWGLMKDLLVPFREQKATMMQGRWYLVYVYLDDETERIVASAKIDKFLDNVAVSFAPNQAVDLIIDQETPLGYKVIINNLHRGMLYHNEIFVPLNKGQEIKGYIKQVREDEKIDVALQPMGYDKIDPLSRQLLNALKTNDNFLPFNDKSDAEEIYAEFECSKKNFKKALGALYKKKLIVIDDKGFSAVETD